MSKRIEFSEDLKTWKILGAWEDSEYEERWKKLQEWIHSVQPYGFFRAVDDPRTTKEIVEEATEPLRNNQDE